MSHAPVPLWRCCYQTQQLDKGNMQLCMETQGFVAASQVVFIASCWAACDAPFIYATYISELWRALTLAHAT